MSSSARSVTLSGSLVAATEDTGEPATDLLMEAVQAARAGHADQQQLVSAFRAATVYVEAIPTDDGDRALQWVHQGGLTWVPVFTSLQTLAAFYSEAGRGDDQIDYGELTGAELIDHCLPQLPRGTGMILDPISDHVLALPPVAGIVPDDLAIPTDP